MCSKMGEEEVSIELEAVQAVYGDDCVVLDSFPPHVNLHIKPRTADVSSQQFVEAVIGIRAGSKYPEDPPHISLIDSKGLDEQRQNHLIRSIQDKATELSSCSMLVTLCEAAVEKLTSLNHPDGDCPLCLSPLVSEDEQYEAFPFMKLMSCFHCFHSECIIRWWKWLRTEKETNPNYSSSATLRPMRDGDHQNDVQGEKGKSMGNCPVCRKVFHAKDFDHVLDLVGTHLSQLSSDGDEVSDDEILDSTSENIRREKFEVILKLQQENSGLIEPKRDLVVLPGMFLPQPVSTDSQTLKEEATEQQQPDSTVSSEPNSSGSSYKPRHRGHQRSGRTSRRPRTSRGEATGIKQRDPTVSSEPNSSGFSYRPGHQGHRNSGTTSTDLRTSQGDAAGLPQRDPAVSSERITSSSSTRPGHRGHRSSGTSTYQRTSRGEATGTQQRDPTVHSEPNASCISNRPSSQGQWKSGRRDQRVPRERKQAGQWIRKENSPANQ